MAAVCDKLCFITKLSPQLKWWFWLVHAAQKMVESLIWPFRLLWLAMGVKASASVLNRAERRGWEIHLELFWPKKMERRLFSETGPYHHLSSKRLATQRLTVLLCLHRDSCKWLQWLLSFSREQMKIFSSLDLHKLVPEKSYLKCYFYKSFWYKQVSQTHESWSITSGL